MLLRRRCVLLDGAGRSGQRRRRRLGNDLRLIEQQRRRTPALRPPFLRVDTLDLDPRRAAFGIAELFGGRVGEVDDAVGIERPAIVDAQDHRAIVVQVGHFDVAGQRQGLVRGTHAVQVIDLAIGGVLTMKLGAIPGGSARSDVTLGIAHRKVGLAQHGVRVGLVGAGVQGWRCIRDTRDIHIPPRRAVLVGTVDVQPRHRAHDGAAFWRLRRRCA